MGKKETRANALTLTTDKIESRIFTIRGLQVMLDKDLATMYQVEVKRLNEQVRRNFERFPAEFCFQLIEVEFKALILRSQIATSNKRGGRRYLPYVFTEQGIAMLSAVLHSDTAIKVSIQIMHTFVKMRKIISYHMGLVQRVEGLEQKQIETDKKIDDIFNALENEGLSLLEKISEKPQYSAYSQGINTQP
jgi:hypothetical protein